MAGFKDIVGNEQIIEHLQNAISMGKVSHAYIINGPQLSGKMMIAEAFARALRRRAQTVVESANRAIRQMTTITLISYMSVMKSPTTYRLTTSGHSSTTI